MTFVGILDAVFLLNNKKYRIWRPSYARISIEEASRKRNGEVHHKR